MTFLEVLDDAVKIGLGAFSGWLIAKGTRWHEFERERRRRKQDCLERVVEDLDEHESAFDAFCADSLGLYKVRNEGGNPEVEKMINDQAFKHIDTSEVALTKLNQSRSKLIVFGFDKCAASLIDYHCKVLDLAVAAQIMQRGGEKEFETFHSEKRELIKFADTLRKDVTKAFATL